MSDWRKKYILKRSKPEEPYPKPDNLRWRFEDTRLFVDLHRKLNPEQDTELTIIKQVKDRTTKEWVEVRESIYLTPNQKDGFKKAWKFLQNRADWLERHKGFGVYYGINARLPGNANRKYQARNWDVSTRNLIPFDLDHCSVVESEPIYQQLVNQFGKHSIVRVCSGNGVQILIRIPDYPIASIHPYCQSLITDFQSRYPCIDPTSIHHNRIFRLPGTPHTKDPWNIKLCHTIDFPMPLVPSEATSLPKAKPKSKIINAPFPISDKHLDFLVRFNLTMFNKTKAFICHTELNQFNEVQTRRGVSFEWGVVGMHTESEKLRKQIELQYQNRSQLSVFYDHNKDRDYDIHLKKYDDAKEQDDDFSTHGVVILRSKDKSLINLVRNADWFETPEGVYSYTTIYPSKWKDIKSWFADLPRGIRLIDPLKHEQFLPLPFAPKLGCNDERSYHRYIHPKMDGQRLSANLESFRKQWRSKDLKSLTYGSPQDVSESIPESKRKKKTSSKIQGKNSTYQLVKYPMENQPLKLYGIPEQGLRTNYVLEASYRLAKEGYTRERALAIMKDWLAKKPNRSEYYLTSGSELFWEWVEMVLDRCMTFDCGYDPDYRPREKRDVESIDWIPSERECELLLNVLGDDRLVQAAIWTITKLYSLGGYLPTKVIRQMPKSQIKVGDVVYTPSKIIDLLLSKHLINRIHAYSVGNKCQRFEVWLSKGSIGSPDGHPSSVE